MGFKANSDGNEWVDLSKQTGWGCDATLPKADMIVLYCVYKNSIKLCTLGNECDT